MTKPWTLIWDNGSREVHSSLESAGLKVEAAYPHNHSEFFEHYEGDFYLVYALESDAIKGNRPIARIVQAV